MYWCFCLMSVKKVKMSLFLLGLVEFLRGKQDYSCFMWFELIFVSFQLKHATPMVVSVKTMAVGNQNQHST